MKIKTGDNVKIINGKDRGKTGKVVQLLKGSTVNEMRVVIEDTNTLTKHLRSQKAGEKGQKVQFSAPVHISNVMLLDASGKPTRVGYKQEGSSKKRIAKKTGEFLS